MPSHILPAVLSYLARSSRSLFSYDSPPSPLSPLPIPSYTYPNFWSLADRHWIPVLNVLLAILVFLYLVDERANRLLSVWSDWARGRSVASTDYNEKAVLSSFSGEKEGAHMKPAPNEMAVWEQRLLYGLLSGTMLSMTFYSNSILDEYVLSFSKSGFVPDDLAKVASLFASFTMLNVFLEISITIALLSPTSAVSLPPLVTLLCPILLCATIVNRFSLAIQTFDPRSIPHLVLLVGEPALLGLIAAWLRWGLGARRGVPEDDAERAVGL